MSKEDLWGDLPEVERIKTPFVILKEQSELLTEKTNGLLVGEVSGEQTGTQFDYSLNIVAPTLNNYTYTIVNMTHGITLYPLVLRGMNKGFSCDNEEKFKEYLHEIFTLSTTHDVISKLLAHIKAQE
jgi:hypothetical protein